MASKFVVEYDFSSDNSSFSFKKFNEELRKHHDSLSTQTINTEVKLHELSTIIEMVIGTSVLNADKKAEEIIENVLNSRFPYWRASWMNSHISDLFNIFRRSFDGFVEAERKYYDLTYEKEWYE